MSISTIEVIMGRIESATEVSPIAVFYLDVKCGKLNAVFADTVVTGSAIKNNPKSLVGIFDNTMDRFIIRNELNRASKAPLLML